MKRITQGILALLIVALVSSVGWSGASAIRDDVILLNGTTFRDATTPDTVKQSASGLLLNLAYPLDGSKGRVLAWMTPDSLYEQWTVTDSTHIEISAGLKTAQATAPASFTAIDTINTIVAGQGVKKVNLNFAGYDQIWLIYKPLSNNKKALAGGNHVYAKLLKCYTPAGS